MEFALNEEQQAVEESARAVFSNAASPERVDEIEKTEERFDAQLWQRLASANLLGLAVPEEHGGSGLGLSELCVVLAAQGRSVAPVPYWATTVLGAMPIAKFGTSSQTAALLPGVAAGSVKLSAALDEVSVLQSASAPSGGADRGKHQLSAPVTARSTQSGWILDGTVRAVPQAHLARRVLVPCSTSQGVAVFMVDPSSKGVELERAVTTDRQVHPHLHFHDAVLSEDEVLVPPGQGEQAVEWMLERARTGLCALALGVCEEAVRATANFLNERHQFGRPLSSFQATMLRTADAYIDTEAIRVTMWQAAWRLDTDRPAAEAVAAAKWWASEAGQRVVHSTQHLHGGLGADIEYPIHRYFLWGKQIELMLGTPASELARLGVMLRDDLATSEGRR